MLQSQSLKLTKKERKKLIAHLPKNWAKLLGEQLEVSESHVRNVVYGLRNNEKIIAAAIKLAAENSAVKGETRKLLKEVANAS